MIPFRLLEIVHADQKLYLVFEFLEMDLKRFMEHGNQIGTPVTLELVKVSFRPPGLSVSPSARVRLHRVAPPIPHGTLLPARLSIPLATF